MRTLASALRDSRAVAFPFTIPAALVALGFVGYFALPPGVLRAVFVLPAVLWVPGHCLISRLDLARYADYWSSILAVLFSIVLVIVTALLVYAAIGHVSLGTLPLWVSLGALPLTLRRRRTAPMPADTGHSRTRFGAVFAASVLAAAGIVAGVYHVLPTQQQPGYLAFSFSGSYAKVSGVVNAQAGSVLDIPVAITATQQNLSGLSVEVALNGHPLPGSTAIVFPADHSHQGNSQQGSPQQGWAMVKITIPAGCLSRFSFTLDRGSTALRLLDLYVTTTKMAACDGKQ